MIAYDRELLENSLMLEQAEALQKAGFMTREHYLQAATQLPKCNTSRNILVRMGFFFLGSLLFGSIGSLVSFLGFAGNLEHYEIALYVNGIIGIAGAEYFVRRDFFAYGLEDAFILGFALFLAGAVGVSAENFTIAALVVAIAALFGTIRYVHTPSALLAVLGITAVLGGLVFELEVLEQAYLPLLGLALAVLLYTVQHYLRTMPDAPFYESALLVVQVFAIVLGCASVNYLVVRELSVALLDLTLLPGQDIPMAPLFYILTFALPAGLFFFGLRRQKRILLFLGSVGLVAAVLSIRQYYYFLEPGFEMLLAGALLFGLALWAIRKLRHKESGLTYERDKYDQNNSMLYAQAMLINTQLDLAAPTQTESPMTYGGGGFSGGGAGDSY